MSGVTSELAAFTASAKAENLPPEVVAAAKTAVLDGLANLVAGSAQPIASIARPYVLSKGGTPEASVPGVANRLPTTSAAWLNGLFTHCLDYEIQGYPAAHGTSSILPAAMALAEAHGRSGADLLLAYSVGWDVQQRLREAGAEADLRGFHPPGVVGPLGAAAASAIMLGLSADETATAFGFAASRAAGLFANNGTMGKATHPASAARAGVESAELAGAGLTANQSIFEDPRGYIAALFGGAFDESAAVAGLGSRWHLVDPGYMIKPYPAEIFMQWPINAARDLREEHQLDPADIVRVEVEPPVFRKDLSRPAPGSGLDGKFSYEYCVAVALTEPSVRISSFSDEVRFSGQVESMLQRITLVENPATPSDKRQTWATVRAELTDGRTVSARCTKFVGDPSRPMTRDAHLAKVRDCLATGGLAAHQADLVIDFVDSIESRPGVAELMSALRSAG